MAKKSAKDNRPTMSRKQANLQAAIAGHAAVQKASKAGADPKVIRQIARGASKQTIGGIEIGAASLNSMVALDKCWATEAFTKASNIMHLVYMAFAYLRPDEALAALEQGEAQFVRATEAFSKEVPLMQIKDIAAAIRGHIADLTGGGSAEEAPAGESRV